MIIDQLENGNIVIYNDARQIQHILPTAYIHAHPRMPYEAILISSSTDCKNEQQGISILARNVRSIKGKSFGGNVDSLKSAFKQHIVLGGGGTPKDDTPKTKESDPKYVEYLQANTYEKLLRFVKKYKSNVGGITKQGDKIIQEEFLCQFKTFILKVSLRYQYKKSNPKLVDYILMYGGSQYVHKPKKVFLYGGNNIITGYVYKEALED